MIIKELDLVSFGKFKNKKIELKEGLNVIYGYNEAGKSTIHSFIQGMFYGFFNPFTKTKRYTSDYEKYLPWNSDSYRGVLKYGIQGNIYRIERNFLKGNDDVKIFDDFVGKDISDFFEYNKVTRVFEPGTTHLGVSNTVYENTLSTKQSKCEISNEIADHIKERIVNTTQSMDEDISVVNILKQLDDNIKKIGTLKKAKSKIGVKSSQIERLKKLENECIKKDDELNKYQREIHNLQIEIINNESKADKLKKMVKCIEVNEQNIKQLQIKEIKENLKDIQSQIDRLKKYDNISLEDKELIVRIDSNVMNIKDNLIVAKKKYNKNIEKLDALKDNIEEVLNNSVEDTKTSKSNVDDIEKKIRFNKIAVGMLLLITVFTYINMSKFKYSLVVLGMSIIAAIYLTIKNKNLRKSRNSLFCFEANNNSKVVSNEIIIMLKEQVEQENEDIKFLKRKLTNEYQNIESILKNNHVSDIDEYNKGYNSKVKLEQLKEKLSSKNILLDQLLLETGNDNIENTVILDDYNNMIDSVEDFNKEEILNDLEQVNITLSSNKENLAVLNEKVRSLSEKGQNLKDVSEELYRCRQDLKTLENRLNSIKLARDTIMQLSQNIHRDFAPKLHDTIDNIITKITDGKYKEIKVTEDLDIKVVDHENSKMVSINSLSAGTIDQIFLATRIGLLEALNSQVNFPLVFDDSFVLYDDYRLNAMIGYLIDLSKQRQVILFTCQQREIKCLENRGLEYNLIKVNVQH